MKLRLRLEWRFHFATYILVLLLAASASAQVTAVNYVVDLSDPARHLVHVQMFLPQGTAQHDLQMPVWNALYQVRDFAQYVNWVRAKDRAGRELPVRELNDSCWQIAGTEKGAIVEYEIFANSPGAFGAQLNEHHAFFNLAQILMYPVDRRNGPFTINFKIKTAGWRIAAALRTGVDVWVANNYDELVDGPVEIGTFQESDFEDSSAHYHVVVDAEPGDYDMDKIVAGLKKIVAAATSWMNDRPYKTYTFFYHFPHGPGGGGMEHAYSTAIDVSAETLKSSPAALPAVTAHEFFHLWNVKRIRPQSLEPIDYTQENPSRALWFSEGCTSTAEGIIELRAGLLDERGYLARLGEEITELERRPAHLTQSVEESSLDAWLEGYPYYRRADRSISYYNKGELLGVMLDLQLREASHGSASLRELFEWMNDNYAKEGRFFPDSQGVREAGEAVSHADLGPFFERYVAGTEEIPWDDFLRTVGLHVVTGTSTVPDAGFMASRDFDGPVMVDDVSPGSEAERAGLRVGDTIIEIQGRPASQEWRQQIFQLKPGDTLALKVRPRRGAERELKFKTGSREETSYQVKDLEHVSAEQRARRAAWLKGEAQPANARATLAGPTAP